GPASPSKAILTANRSMVGPGCWASARKPGRDSRALCISADMTGSLRAREKSGEWPGVPVPDGDPVRPAARAAFRIAANPFAVLSPLDGIARPFHQSLKETRWACNE